MAYRVPGVRSRFRKCVKLKVELWNAERELEHLLGEVRGDDDNCYDGLDEIVDTAAVGVDDPEGIVSELPDEEIDEMLTQFFSDHD